MRTVTMREPPPERTDGMPGCARHPGRPFSPVTTQRGERDRHRVLQPGRDREVALASRCRRHRRASAAPARHRGAESGTERVTPLAYWKLTDTGVAVLASNYGAPRHPSWYHNLRAHPDTTAEIGDTTWNVQASVATPAERDHLLQRMTRSAPLSRQLQPGRHGRFPA